MKALILKVNSENKMKKVNYKQSKFNKRTIHFT